MKYKLDQFPKNKDLDLSLMSNCQLLIRNNVLNNSFDFYSTRQFADYIFKKHGILQSTTEKRVSNGYNELDCTLDSSSLRSKAQCKRRKNNPELCSK